MRVDLRGGPGPRGIGGDRGIERPVFFFAGFGLSVFPSSGSARSSFLEAIWTIPRGGARGRAPRAPGAARGGGVESPAGGWAPERPVVAFGQRTAVLSAFRLSGFAVFSPRQARGPVERMRKLCGRTKARAGLGDGLISTLASRLSSACVLEDEEQRNVPGKLSSPWRTPPPIGCRCHRRWRRRVRAERPTDSHARAPSKPQKNTHVDHHRSYHRIGNRGDRREKRPKIS